jgi:hypothetical protein
MTIAKEISGQLQQWILVEDYKNGLARSLKAVSWRKVRRIFFGSLPAPYS